MLFFMFSHVEGPIVEFHGWEVIGYYLNNIQNYLAEYSWQVRTAYGLIVGCIFVMIILFGLFILMIRKTTKYKKEYQQLEEKFREPLYQIMILPEPPSVQEIEGLMGCNFTELKRYDSAMFAQLISSLRMELCEVLYIPNMQYICKITGVTDYIERCLIGRTKVFEILQMVVNLNIRISEGELAIYLNHHNTNIRLMARLAYIICTENEPYKYLEEDLNQRMLPWRPMLTHRLFGWLQECGRPMPSFIVIAESLDNEEASAFLIEEVAYWGTDTEKNELSKFFLAPRYIIRLAAMRATAQLAREANEQALVESYDHQPEYIKREVLKTVLAINSGKQLDFYEKAYKTASSKETQEQALSCMYMYGNEGRRRFEMIRSSYQVGEETRTLLDQIDATNLLKQLQQFS
ncbi:MAG: hypothetical protein IKN15_08240 [Bacteroidaceae bacterium]|nr:hypothetical protein [Bacteroidaceae bacterium]